MEIFRKVKAVKLRSHFDNYLVAGDDKQTVRQSRNGSSHRARWLVEATGHVVRLKSCYGRYLTASRGSFLLGETGKRVTQTVPGRVSNSLVEWEPIRDGFQMKLRARSGQYLRANGGLPPWRNSITHDSPSSIVTRDWVLWDVEAVDMPDCETILDYFSVVSGFPTVSDGRVTAARARMAWPASILASLACPKISTKVCRFPCFLMFICKISPLIFTNIFHKIHSLGFPVFSFLQNSSPHLEHK